MQRAKNAPRPGQQRTRHGANDGHRRVDEQSCTAHGGDQTWCLRAAQAVKDAAGASKATVAVKMRPRGDRRLLLVRRVRPWQAAKCRGVAHAADTFGCSRPSASQEGKRAVLLYPARHQEPAGMQAVYTQTSIPLQEGISWG